MSQHGYMRHTATPPLVLEIGQKLCQYYPILTTLVFNLTETLGRELFEVLFTAARYVPSDNTTPDKITRYV